MASIQTPITDLDDLLITINPDTGTGGIQGAVVSKQDPNAGGDLAYNATAGTIVSGTAAFDFGSTGLAAGDVIEITGNTTTAANNTTVIIANVNGSTLTVFDSGAAASLTTQAAEAGTNVTFTRVVNEITIECAEEHGVTDDLLVNDQLTGATTTTTVPSTGAFATTNAFTVGQRVFYTDAYNNHVLCTVAGQTDDLLTFESTTPITIGGVATDWFVVQDATYINVTYPNWAGTGYTGRYLVKDASTGPSTLTVHAYDPSAFSIPAGLAGTNVDNTTAEYVGEVMEDNDLGVYQTPEIIIDAPNKTIQLNNAGNLFTPGSGVVGQALYSFLKERWKEVSGLTRFDFPMLSITNEQFEFINGYTPADETTRKMIRTAGWAERGADNLVRREYSGIVTLGELGTTDQPYFVQEGNPDSPFFNTTFTGAVNEAVKNYASVTASDISTNSNVISSPTEDLSAFTVDDVILIGGAGAGANATNSFRVTVAGTNSITVEPSVEGGPALANVGAGLHTLTFDAQTTFKIFVRERKKIYVDADLADIGVTEMTYIVYRFPVSNAADLNIATTNDNAIVGAGVGAIGAAGGTITVYSLSANLANVSLDATGNYLETTVAGIGEKFAQSVGHTLTLRQNATSPGAGLAAEDLGDYVISAVTVDGGGAGVDRITFDSVAGRSVTTTDSATSGEYDIVEKHGLYVNAPVFLDVGANNANANGAYNVASIIDEERFTIEDTAAPIVADGHTAINDATASARLQYIGAQTSTNGTYVSLEYLEDTYTGLYIWPGTDTPEGTDSSAFGEAKTGLTVDVVANSNTITDQAAGANALNEFFVGQFVQVEGMDNDNGIYKVSASTADSITLVTATDTVPQFSAANTDIGVSITTYFPLNHVLQSESNGKWYRVTTAGKVSASNVDPAADDSLGGANSDGSVVYGAGHPNAGTADATFEGSYTVETGKDSAYSIVLDGNTDGTLPTITKEIVYEWSQWALRQPSVIDTALLNAAGPGDDDPGVRIGKIADLLVQFVGSTLETFPGVFVEDINSLDINNVLFYDEFGDTHEYPLEVQVTINFNDNLFGDDDAVFYAYYTNLANDPNFPNGTFRYGEVDAVQVNRIEAGVSSKVGSEEGVENNVPNDGIYTFNYAFDSDPATLPIAGSPAGRNLSEPQGITVVAIGLRGGQYVKASGTITSNGLTLSLVAPLERNYTDPGV